MTRTNTHSYTATLAVSLCLLLPLSAAAQEDNSADTYAPKDTVFVEMTLTEEGVTAIDSSGYDWYYDFATDRFVAGDPFDLELEAGVAGEPTGLDLENLPVEERATIEKKVKPFSRSVIVDYDEYVDGDIIATSRVTVKGWVKGSVKSINNRVLVTRTGMVEGSVEAAEIVIQEGGVVKGDTTTTTNPLEFQDLRTAFSIDGVIVVSAFTVFFLFCSFLVCSLMPRQLDVFATSFRANKVKSFVLGFLLLFFVWVVVLLVAITIVGVVLLPFVPLFYLLAVVMGMTAFGGSIGRIFYGRFFGRNRPGTLYSLLGILTLMVLWYVVAFFMGSTSPALYGFGIAFLVVSILITSYPVFSGIGAALLTRFGFKPYAARPGRHFREAPPPPAPPPIRGTTPEERESAKRDSSGDQPDGSETSEVTPRNPD